MKNGTSTCKLYGEIDAEAQMPAEDKTLEEPARQHMQCT